MAIDLYRFRFFFLINRFKKPTTTIDGIRGDTSFNGRCFTQGEILYTYSIPSLRDIFFHPKKVNGFQGDHYNNGKKKEI